MTLTIQISTNQQYLIGRSSLPITRPVAQEMMKQFIKAIEETDIRKIICDLRGIPNVMDVVDDYSFAYKDAIQLEFPRGVKAVFLIDVGDRTHNFAQTVATNAGYQVKIFDEEEAAIAWLFRR